MRRLLVGCLLAATALLAQPKITNAKLESKAGAGNLTAEVKAIVARQLQPAWIGYAVAAVPGEHNSCCYHSDSSQGIQWRGCMLEGQRPPGVQGAQGPIRLEGSRELQVLLRAEGGQITKIRSFSGDCDLDGGGLPFFWFTGVQPKDSLVLLDSFVSPGATDRDRSAESAIAAIALHSGTDADTYLEKYTNVSRPESLRKKAVFWLGAARGRAGFESLVRVLREDPSDKVKESALHALTVSKELQALKQLIESARSDKSPDVRGKALFWLSQKAGKESAAAIRGAVENDPEMRVKEKAVFALSQLPKEQSVPMLIELARNNRSPEVRKNDQNPRPSDRR
ncbi:MAG: HEAT repeat domain-containing protein [Bryobacteraceae bacterium]